MVTNAKKIRELYYATRAAVELNASHRDPSSITFRLFTPETYYHKGLCGVGKEESEPGMS